MPTHSADMSDTNEQTPGDHWTGDLSEEQMNAVLDAINAGQPFDRVLKSLHTIPIPDN